VRQNSNLAAVVCPPSAVVCICCREELPVQDRQRPFCNTCWYRTDSDHFVTPAGTGQTAAILWHAMSFSTLTFCPKKNFHISLCFYELQIPTSVHNFVFILHVQQSYVCPCKVQWSLYVPQSRHYMYRQFNIQQFYVLPIQCIYVFCVDLRANSDYFPIQH